MEAVTDDSGGAGRPEPSGIAPRERVFGAGSPLPGQVFAIEVLERPVELMRDGEQLVVIVDRRGVERGVYTTAGKRQLVEEAFPTAAAVAAARAEDRRVHDFLTGRSEEQRLMLARHPLRWASGGVLSVVRWRGRRWTPFFFRDIPPMGWNVSLGGSDRGEDLDDPRTILEREFLEETLIATGPVEPGRPLTWRRIVFGQGEPGLELRRAEQLAAEHLELRRRRDGLVFANPAEPPPLARVAQLATSTRVEVLSEAGRRVTRHVLVTINPLELGIEIVMPVELELGDEEVLLDGEILAPSGARGEPELIRMPIALIAQDYLRPAFDRPAAELGYGGHKLASVDAPPIPPGDSHVFEFDARRRLDIVQGRDPGATAFEVERYSGWFAEFGRHFYSPDGQLDGSRPCQLFTAPSAKILSCCYGRFGV